MKHRRTLIAALLLAVLMASLLPAGAAAVPRFVDEMGLLSAQEAAALTAKLDEISARQGFDVVVAVVDTLSHPDAVVAALDYYEANGFRSGGGAILLLAMAERDFGFGYLGSGIKIFTDAAEGKVYDSYIGHLRNSDYSAAFMAYADGVDSAITYHAGAGARNRNYAIIASLVIALLAAAIVTGGWKGQLKSVHKQNFARDYVRSGSLSLKHQGDTFLYRHVNRTAKPQSSSSGGGGNRSVSSSSGSSGGGRSGKF